ncbi:hypothetical protein C3B51_04210 [Pseudoalteromonas rubra]|uniref:Uncharacterized protein n=1 Tax=Pseudoalteromonas rubra TaxID=43658 RepID=A0A4Q7EJS5_9GAMM|nr:hypothetical protein [Pseudoalteromonas rubra]RZM84320.1 hypothetical protein C3B51_04210 [Pseudoalteromonas rubra]
MKVDGFNTTYALPAKQSATMEATNGNTLPQSTTLSEARSVDMNRFGLNELNALIQSTGDERLLFRLPHDTFKLVDGELQGSQSTGLLSQIAREIAFERSIGNDTQELESFLDVLKGYQGCPLQPGIDTSA